MSWLELVLETAFCPARLGYLPGPVHDIRLDIQIVDGVVGGTGWSDRLTKDAHERWGECCVKCLCCCLL